MIPNVKRVAVSSIVNADLSARVHEVPGKVYLVTMAAKRLYVYFANEDPRYVLVAAVRKGRQGYRAGFLGNSSWRKHFPALEQVAVEMVQRKTRHPTRGLSGCSCRRR